MKKILVSLFVLLFIFPSTALAATLSLSPSTGTFNKGCSFSLNIVLDTTGTQTDGTDAIVIYDASRVTAVSIQSGMIYPDYPGNNIDAASGKVTISGLASVSSPFTGQGNLATINFRVLEQAPAGVSQIKFDFDPNDKAKTTDSNVVERGTVVDVLNSVVNGNYTIGTETVCAGQGAVGGDESTPSATQIPFKTLPDAGSEQLTSTLAIIGFSLTILGILGLIIL